MSFVVGQRWASNTESQLGLGTIIDVAGRRIEIAFAAVEETRTYAKDNAPLTRILYSIEDRINTTEQQDLLVTDIQENAGVIFYLCNDENGEQVVVPEMQLDANVHFTTPQQRLFSGQFDSNSAFKLRVDGLQHIDRLQNSPVQGLLGSRSNLLNHQVYIANEVASRHAPRILLADEVGLGKTIEAGMILHQQLYTGLAKRVLILLPDSLIHQWLVEMLRRFNLRFSIFDQERIDTLLESGEDNMHAEESSQEEVNPFDSEQLVICDIELLSKNRKNLEAALAAKWDVLVVDEAHHLHWQQENKSDEYACVEQLSRTIPGVLLLTATPEQAGIESHFARLRLLDPDRFHDLQSFIQEEQSFAPVNQLVESLQKGTALSDEQVKLLKEWLPEVDYPISDTKEVIAKLLDRHGTGRILFRNTRHAIKGFPDRIVNPYSLRCPEIYKGDELDAVIYGEDGLFPEIKTEQSEWLAEDPRVQWLKNFLSDNPEKKILVICHYPGTAITLEQHINRRTNARSTVFHEAMSIVERDRAAAYFASEEEGAQVLICSEIGSEGRNFQFAHDLVLFDLPLNPDLIEQRIGRLDRIGQTENIQIHIPYLRKTAQEIAFHWYHQGLDLFNQRCDAGYAIYQKFAAQLSDALYESLSDARELIEQTKAYTEQVAIQQQKGRDRLLELNSCNKEKAQKLIEGIEEQEQCDVLQEFMSKLCTHYGVEQEDHSEHTIIMRPGENMLDDHFPGLKEDGITVTFSREKALAREDIEFLSWEHPMVSECLDMLQHGEYGNACVSNISVKGVQPGTLLLEAIYSVQSIAPKNLQLDRYFSINPIRLFVDTNKRNLSAALDHKKLNELCQRVPKRVGQGIVAEVRGQVESMLEFTYGLAQQKLDAIKQSAVGNVESQLGKEVARMKALQQVNPTIREDEIDFINTRLVESKKAIARADVKLEGIRLIINS